MRLRVSHNRVGSDATLVYDGAPSNLHDMHLGKHADYWRFGGGDEVLVNETFSHQH